MPHPDLAGRSRDRIKHGGHALALHKQESGAGYRKCAIVKQGFQVRVHIRYLCQAA